jgi:hypothetical protein
MNGVNAWTNIKYSKDSAAGDTPATIYSAIQSSTEERIEMCSGTNCSDYTGK